MPRSPRAVVAVYAPGVDGKIISTASALSVADLNDWNDKNGRKLTRVNWVVPKESRGAFNAVDMAFLTNKGNRIVVTWHKNAALADAAAAALAPPLATGPES